MKRVWLILTLLSLLFTAGCSTINNIPANDDMPIWHSSDPNPWFWND